MKVQVLTALAALTLSTAASAQLYGVGSVGLSRFDTDCSGTASCDKSDTAFKLMGGYKFTPTIAVEVGYFDFGKAKGSALGVNVEEKLNGFGAGAAFHVDLAPSWTGVARLGLAQMKTKLTGSSGATSLSDSDTNTSLYGGLGVGYRLNKQVTIDGAWDFSKAKYNKNFFGTPIDSSDNVNAFSVGVTFGF